MDEADHHEAGVMHGKPTELKMQLDVPDTTSTPYGGSRLVGSRLGSATENQIRSSFLLASRKLNSTRTRVRFYVTGGSNHGAMYAVSPQRFTTFDSLLAKLTKNPLCATKRDGEENYIFSMKGAHKITSLEELESGESYVCATHEVFDQIQSRSRPQSPQKLRQQHLEQQRMTAGKQTAARFSALTANEEQEDEVMITQEGAFLRDLRPKLITVLRAGLRPRKSIRILLNKQTVKSFEQVIKGISDIISPNHSLKKIYNLSGKMVLCLADFYLDDTVFIGMSSHEKLFPEELILDPTEVRLVSAYRFKRPSTRGRVTLNSHLPAIKNKDRPHSQPTSSLDSRYQLSRAPSAQGGKRSRSARLADHPEVLRRHLHEKHSTEDMEKNAPLSRKITPPPTPVSRESTPDRASHVDVECVTTNPPTPEPLEAMPEVQSRQETPKQSIKETIEENKDENALKSLPELSGGKTDRSDARSTKSDRSRKSQPDSHSRKSSRSGTPRSKGYQSDTRSEKSSHLGTPRSKRDKSDTRSEKSSKLSTPRSKRDQSDSRSEKSSQSGTPRSKTDRSDIHSRKSGRSSGTPRSDAPKHNSTQPDSEKSDSAKETVNIES